MPSLTGGLWNWLRKGDNPGRDLTTGVWLATSMAFPPLFLAPLAAFGVTATADLVNAGLHTPRRRAAAARRTYEQTLKLIDASSLDDVEKYAAREHARQKYLKQLNGTL